MGLEKSGAANGSVRKESTPSTPSTIGLTVVFSFVDRKLLIAFDDLPFIDKRGLIVTKNRPDISHHPWRR
jgi:hypothetical protein